jgi:hypothetical protein
VESGQDFEWYPTTSEIIDVIVKSVVNDREVNHRSYSSPQFSILDCGAGDGRFLAAFDDAKKYAIEKSRPLLDSLPANVFIVGTDFHEQTLIDKKVDVVFCNPPYTEYEQWASKIITEANASYVYLVIPRRWTNSTSISNALSIRDVEAKSIGGFDFENAERKARAKVDIVRIDLEYRLKSERRSGITDPFTIWFDTHFKISADTTENHSVRSSGADLKAKIKEMVVGGDLVGCLVELYQNELAELVRNYKALETIDAALLKELDVNVPSVRGALEMKISGLKDRYWKELFDNLHSVTDKLTCSSRKEIMKKLTGNTHIDFTSSNARALIIWVLKNANQYFDDQLIDTVEQMTEMANVSLYKSNNKTYGEDDWRYSASRDLDRYSLEYRVILHRCGGISTSSWTYDSRSGLEERAFNFLSDLLTISCNLGYDHEGINRIGDFEWKAGKGVDIMSLDVPKGKEVVLMNVRAHKNGNIHIKFNQRFMVRLNVEFGRLKGWLKTASDASDELGIEIEKANDSFKSNLRIGSSDFALLPKMSA